MTVVEVRPRRLRVVCWLVAILLVVGAVAISRTIHGRTPTGGYFRSGDQLAMVGVGVLLAGAVLAVTRLRVRADERGIWIRNLVGTYDVPWELVVAVRMADRSLCASIELAADERIPLMAVQPIDGEYALAAVVGLRRLHAARHALDQ